MFYFKACDHMAEKGGTAQAATILTRVHLPSRLHRTFYNLYFIYFKASNLLHTLNLRTYFPYSQYHL